MGSEFVVRLPLHVDWPQMNGGGSSHVGRGGARRTARAEGGAFSSPTTTSTSRRAWDSCSS